MSMDFGNLQVSWTGLALLLAISVVYAVAFIRYARGRTTGLFLPALVFTVAALVTRVLIGEVWAATRLDDISAGPLGGRLLLFALPAISVAWFSSRSVRRQNLGELPTGVTPVAVLRTVAAFWGGLAIGSIVSLILFLSGALVSYHRL